MIKEESSFDVSAKSKAGAVGLTQILPSTAQFISKGDFNSSKLYDIDYNISLGAKYFAHLKEMFNGNELFSVIAYNAGPGIAKQWVSANKTNDLDEFVENIPYVETKVYVQKVYSSYWNDTRIYAKK